MIKAWTIAGVDINYQHRAGAAYESVVEDLSLRSLVKPAKNCALAFGWVLCEL